LNRYEAYEALSTAFEAKIGYSLGVTSFTQKETDSLAHLFMPRAKAKMGINRRTPKCITYGPWELRGNQLWETFTEQGLKKAGLVINHLRLENDETGELLRIERSCHQLELGNDKPFFGEEIKNLRRLCDSSWLTNLAEFFWKHKITLHDDPTNRVPTLQRANDEFLTNIFGAALEGETSQSSMRNR
jgi:hypothetical protein